MVEPFLTPTDTLSNTTAYSFPAPSRKASTRIYITVFLAFEALVQSYYLL